MEIGQLIVKTPGTCGGRARIAGNRVPVSVPKQPGLISSVYQQLSSRHRGVPHDDRAPHVVHVLLGRRPHGGPYIHSPAGPSIRPSHHNKYHRAVRANPPCDIRGDARSRSGFPDLPGPAIKANAGLPAGVN